MIFLFTTKAQRTQRKTCKNTLCDLCVFVVKIITLILPKYLSLLRKISICQDKKKINLNYFQIKDENKYDNFPSIFRREPVSQLVQREFEAYQVKESTYAAVVLTMESRYILRSPLPLPDYVIVR